MTHFDTIPMMINFGLLFTGALGLLATEGLLDVESTLCLISGTSACHMILSKEKKIIPGIWGPYFSAILEKYWLHEGPGMTCIL